MSDANLIHAEVTPEGKPVVEIEFKFIRYRLVLDDEQKSRELLACLRQALAPKPEEKKAVKLPHFYRDKK